MRYVLLLLLLATPLVVHGQEGGAPWAGVYDVYEPGADGWQRCQKYMAFEIARIGDTYMLHRFPNSKITPIELVEEKGHLKPKDGKAAPIIRKQNDGPNVLQVQFSFQILTLVKGDVPKWWVMADEKIEIDETLFNDISDTTSDLPIPADLKLTYSKFVRWHSGKWRYTDFFLPRSVTFLDPQGQRAIGKPLNTCILLTDVFDKRFNPKVLQFLSIQDGCYRMQTASTEFLWIQTKAGDWRIYHYRDLAEPDRQPSEEGPKVNVGMPESGSVKNTQAKD